MFDIIDNCVVEMTNAKIVKSSVKVRLLRKINLKSFYLLKFDEAFSHFNKKLSGVTSKVTKFVLPLFLTDINTVKIANLIKTCS